MADKNTIKNWFRTNLVPTQAQFSATWDSFWHKDETIPITAIDDIENILAEKADAEVLAHHLTDTSAHANLFNAKEDKSKRGAALGYAPLNEFTKLAIDYLNVVNDLVTGGESSLLTAEQGKLLQVQITAINTLLTSNDINLDTVQEIVNAIKTVQTSLSTILVNDLTTGGTTKALTAEMGKNLKALIDNRVNFKVFSCQISQSNSGNPEISIAQNNLGITIPFIRESPGIYKGIFSNTPISNTGLIVPFAALGSVTQYYFGGDDLTLNGSPSVHASYFDDGWQEGIKVVSLLNGKYSDSILYKAYLEIKAY
ncbi:MAG: hypothetical protein PHF81_10920 [Flavobacterium sp.]|nr:hypothetical protein [Flavobacterium sp.]